MSEFESISPDDREGHFAAKAEGDSNAALSRFGAAARLDRDLIELVGRPHIERMLDHAKSIEAK